MNRSTWILVIAIVVLWTLASNAGELSRPGLALTDLATGASRLAPALDMEVSLRSTGPLTRARVVQKFRNEGDTWVEGVYVFPLPESAAVDSLRLRVGERVFEGRIEERSLARKRYVAARRRGSKASLVEQERPNLFTTTIANIGPGEEVEVELEYQELLRFVDGRFELHFPMAMTPRYTAGTRPARDAHRVARPAVESSDLQACHVDVFVDLDMGLPLARIESPSHELHLDPGTAGEAPRTRERIELHGIPADRDFVLRWWPEIGLEPRASVFAEERDGSHYVMATVFPPSPGAPARSLSRELVLVIDTSGSMQGASIEQAKSALEHALTSLSPADYVNVIRFDTGYRALFPESRPADSNVLRHAARFVRALDANGGTEMSPALEAALEDPGLPVAVRQLVFVTDGAVAGEARLFELIERRLGRTRLFPVGIGSAPNRHLLARAALFGRGATVTIAKSSEVAARMDELLDKIETPVLTQLDLHWNDAAEMWPQRVPDVYAGEPLVVVARIPRLVGALEIAARRDGDPWGVSLPLSVSHAESGVAKLWARRKIGSLMDARRRGIAPAAMRREIVAVALEHHLVSRFTSLVSVDVTPERPRSEPLTSHAVAGVQPAGTQANVPGILPRGATASPLLLYAGVLCCVLSLLALRIQGPRR